MKNVRSVKVFKQKEQKELELSDHAVLSYQIIVRLLVMHLGIGKTKRYGV